MHKEYTDIGLVLRTYYPLKEKIALLDKTSGRFDALVQGSQPYRICNGALIAYTATNQALKTITLVKNIDQLYVPFAWAAHDLSLLHGLLQLSMACIPYGMTAPLIIDSFMTFYQLYPASCTPLMRNVLVLRMLSGMGLHSAVAVLTEQQMNRLLTGDLDKIAQQGLELSVEQAVAAWIRSCLHSYSSEIHLSLMSLFL